MQFSCGDVALLEEEYARYGRRPPPDVCLGLEEGTQLSLQQIKVSSPRLPGRGSPPPVYPRLATEARLRAESPRAEGREGREHIT